MYEAVERNMNSQSHFFETHGRVERAYLVAVCSDEGESLLSTEDSLSELDALARTAGAEVVGTLIQHLRHPDSATYLGKGRAQELSDLEKQLGFDLVIADDELTPTQQRNLEDLLNARVVDRTALILDIFAQHARTREGRLQVELAQLEYRLPRLTERGTDLSRVGGGSIGGAIGVRGPGETKLEIDRRRIRHRIAEIRKEIESIREQRRLNRQQRAAQAIPAIVVVGYTNAGKSTLFNALTAANVVAENALFATLDPTTRHLTLPHNQEALLTDTVGFIQKLPTELIAAFRATLEEVSAADLLLEVVDSHHKNLFEQSETVNRLLVELGAAETPRITALNKIDLVENSAALDTRFFPHAVQVSALKGEGLDKLREEIARVLAESMIPICVTIPYDKGELVELFHRRGHVELEEHLEDGTLLLGRIAHRLRDYYMPYLCVPHHAITSDEGRRKQGV